LTVDIHFVFLVIAFLGAFVVAFLGAFAIASFGAFAIAFLRLLYYSTRKTFFCQEFFE